MPVIVPAGPRRTGRLRTLLALLLALLCASVLAGCGSDAGDAESDSAGPTRTVKDIEGTEVQVPENPQRVVTLSEPTLDGALALGVKPVGSVAGRGQSGVPHYLADKADGVKLLGSVSELDYEAIGAMDPDLILVDGTSVNNRPDVLEILRKIAPVVFTGYAGGPWEKNFDRVADALNLQDKARQIEQDYRSTVEQDRQKLAGRYGDKTFSIVRWQGGGASLILKELPAGRALTDLGLKRPQNQDRMGLGHSDPVSLENLNQTDADYMFFGTLGGSSQDNPNAGGTADLSGAQTALKEAEKASGFTDLTAYKDGHIIPVDGSRWTSTGGPLLMQGIVADVMKDLDQ